MAEIQGWGTSLISQLGITLVGSLAVGWALFQFLVKTWVEQTIKGHEAKAEYDRKAALAELEGDIDRKLDRYTKLNQREFELLGDIWQKLVDAVSAVESTQGLKRRPQLSLISDDRCSELLADLKLTQGQIDHVMSKKNAERDELYFRYCQGIEAFEARQKALDSSFALTKGSIFLPSDVVDRLRELQDLVWLAAADVCYQADRAPDDGDFRADRLSKFMREGTALTKSVEAFLRERFHAPAASANETDEKVA